MRPDVVRGNVFVANLPHGFTDEQLAELFDPYGIVLRAYLVRDSNTGETQGHGLVELAPERIVSAAIEAVSAERPGGRRVDVRRADATMCIVAKRPSRQRAMPATIYADDRRSERLYRPYDAIHGTRETMHLRARESSETRPSFKDRRRSL